MRLFLWNVLLAIVWMFLTGHLAAANLLLGFVLGYAGLAAVAPLLAPSAYFRTVPRVLIFLGWFAIEVLRASARVAHDIVTPRHRARPGIVAVPVDDLGDAGVTLLSSLIGLTPGTLVLDVSPDRKTVYVHAMFVETPDAVRKEIRNGLLRRLRGIVP